MSAIADAYIVACERAFRGRPTAEVAEFTDRCLCDDLTPEEWFLVQAEFEKVTRADIGRPPFLTVVIPDPPLVKFTVAICNYPHKSPLHNFNERAAAYSFFSALKRRGVSSYVADWENCVLTSPDGYKQKVKDLKEWIGERPEDN